MIQRLLPVILSMTLFGPLLLAGAGAEDLRDARRNEGRPPKQQAPIAKSNDGKTNDGKTSDGKILVTRSDGSTGRTTPPDPKQIRKLVGYMRDGMNRADRSERQREISRRVNRIRR